MSRRTLALLYACLALTGLREARAENVHPCIVASEEGQRLRDEHKLLAARAQFASCASESCPVLIRKTCEQWLNEVTGQQPTVVVGARDRGGRDIVLAKVYLDRALVASKLDGAPLEIDPGEHLLRLEAEGFAPVEQTFVARQGDANRELTVVLPPVEGASPTGSAPLQSEIVSAPVGPLPGSAGGAASRTWRAAGWVSAAAGAVALGAGAVFGVTAVVETQAASCVNSHCLAGPLNRARTAAVGADVGIVSGSVLLGGGIALLLLTPTRASERSGSSARIGAWAGPGRAEIHLVTEW